jgi:hypothetical protein
MGSARHVFKAARLAAFLLVPPAMEPLRAWMAWVLAFVTGA